MYKCCVTTPVSIEAKSSSYDEVRKCILHEFRQYGCWTEECSSCLQNSPKVLFAYDRLEYACSKAFGCNKFKIVLNLVMVLCYHPKCIEEDKPPVRLANACSIHSYLLHLASHDYDEIGKAMFARFSAMYSNAFCEDYDSISPSPYC